MSSGPETVGDSSEGVKVVRGDEHVRSEGMGASTTTQKSICSGESCDNLDAREKSHSTKNRALTD